MRQRYFGYNAKTGANLIFGYEQVMRNFAYKKGGIKNVKTIDRNL